MALTHYNQSDTAEDLSLHSGDAEDITGMIIRGALPTPMSSVA